MSSRPSVSSAAPRRSTPPTLRARVEGFLEERRARDGERVTAGDTLFLIEPAPYEAALAQAEASVAEAEAALQLAEVDLARSTQLRQRDTISQADLDASVANRATAEARAAGRRGAPAGGRAPGSAIPR